VDELDNIKAEDAELKLVVWIVAAGSANLAAAAMAAAAWLIQFIID
jgi:hypothetical protein